MIHDLGQFIAQASPDLIRVMARQEAQTTIFILLLLAADQVLRNPSPRFRYTLWLLGLGKALWPPFLSLGVLDLFSRQPVVAENLTVVFQAPAVIGSVALPVIPSFTWGTLAFAAWSGLTLIVTALIIVNFIRFRLRLRPPHVQPYDIQEKVSATGRPWPAIWATDRIHSPMTMGLTRPRIYVTWQAVRSGPRALRAILYHELAHIMRRDGWVSLLQAIALAIHPFNPLVWLMNARLSRYREQLCDDFALRHTGVAPREYGNMLLDQLGQGNLPQLAAHTPTYFFETKRDLVHRLSELTRRKGDIMRVITTSQKILLVALMFGLLFSASQCTSTRNLPPPRPEEDSNVVFVAYDERPIPAGGFQVLMQNVIYPEEARQAGIQGLVTVQAFIDVNGDVSQTVILESNSPSLNQAAIDAVTRTEWIPAKRGDQTVGVWITVPINFNLNSAPPRESTDDSNDTAPPEQESALDESMGDISPPPPEESSATPFIPNDERPVPIGGDQTLMRNVGYPELARQAGATRISIQPEQETGSNDSMGDLPPPPPEEDPKVVFIPYDERPVPVGGDQTLMRNVVYPEMAREAGLQGQVIIQAFINVNGDVTATVTFKSHSPSLDQAAIEAIKRTKWIPAKRRDQAVGVWISIPINFNLNTALPRESADDSSGAAPPEQETGSNDSMGDLPPPPPEEENPKVVFIPYDERPVPVGGDQVLMRNVVYPELARQAGLQGQVIIQAFINVNGDVTETVTIRSHSPSLDQAAIDAIKRTKWVPAQQRDRAIGVWISIPINFNLNTASRQ
ncbi:TonB family protein [Candidatus Neomarinimicrobiota bacterium]